MLQGFYSAAVGAQQQMDRLNVQANNIANVNTYGYRAEKPAFEALMYGMLDGIDGEQLPRGTGALMISTATDFSGAPIEETGRAQDYAIEGEGFFALYNPGTGEVSYTRDGSFTVTVEVAVSPRFYAWIFGFGPDAQILAPAKVREGMARMLAQVAGLYEKKEGTL